MTHPSRREAMTALTLGGAALALGCAPAAPAAVPNPARVEVPTMPAPAALAGKHAVVPLPFRASALVDISERMISSHHENNYGGAVKSLNRVEQELAAIGGSTPPFVVAALRDRELTFRNSKTLHEAYFGNLGGDGRRSGAIDAELAQAYGSSARWEEHFRATGMGLGGGSGWVVLALELETGALRTVAAASHTQSLATAVPLLVLDMYEHSYQMDFGAAVSRYLDAFFVNVRWDEVNRRLERSRRASNALREA
jgi:Fe-Mn family superoxide dismutase